MVWKSKATPASALVADQVFETAELMEVSARSRPEICSFRTNYCQTILLLVKPQDVLRAMQVNRAMRDTVNGSSKIQRAIGLLPDWEADFTPTFWQDCDDEPEDAFHGISYFDYDKRYCRTYDSRFDYIQKG